MERTCKKCGKTKAIEEFYNVNKTRCKQCQRDLAKEWKKKNYERYIIAKKKYRDKHPERYRNGHAIKTRESKDRYNEKIRKRRLSNPDQFRCRQRKWRENNPDSDKKSSTKYRIKIISELADNYISNILKKELNLSRDIIKKHPELIENKRMSIKLKRQIKNKKPEKSIIPRIKKERIKKDDKQQYDKKYYTKNKELILEKQRKYYIANKEYLKLKRKIKNKKNDNNETS